MDQKEGAEKKETVIKALSLHDNQLLSLYHPHIKKFRIKKQGFVQPHIHAIETYYRAIERHIEHFLCKIHQSASHAHTTPLQAWDLYCGGGVFTCAPHFAAQKIGIQIECLGVEGDSHAMESFAANYKQLPSIQGQTKNVDVFLEEHFSQKNVRQKIDIVILDPPRCGAGTANMQKIVELCRPKACVLYLACDPASFARDGRILLEGGFKCVNTLIFDAFAQTTHYEVLGVFER
jgi:23S rRNA (uracil1939-C5)-methyltransferase